MKIALIAPPWIDMPPIGYGGIEWIAHWLTEGLRARGVDVELFATGASNTMACRSHALYGDGQYRHIGGPLFDTVSIPVAHVAHALATIEADGSFDLVHDHNGFVGPAMTAFASSRLPPALHTLHAPFTSADDLRRGLPDNRTAFAQVARGRNIWFNGISHAQLRGAPPAVNSRTVGVVYNAVDVEAMPFCAEPARHMLCLARICADKGQALAARLCRRHQQPLVLAGAIAGIGDRETLERCLAASPHGMPPDLQYFLREVLPHVDGDLVRWVGAVGGARRLDLLARARALLFPIDWEEPFGLAVVEALACGTPVVAMRRGSMPELIDHGVTGFLADDEHDFERYIDMVGLLDRHACREAARSRFHVDVMVDAYLDAYDRVLAAAHGRRSVPVRTRGGWLGARTQSQRGPAAKEHQPVSGRA